ncbi:MAG TPA: FAD-linked oxidase, partial [Blastocatellia bacterium]|nr:FAD-linked oxidase [Blastocatellia bacterium]
LERAKIPYTLHWGQLNNFTPERVRNMYGASVDTWIKSRNTLLDAQTRAVFTSPFLRQCGLG